MLWTFHRGTQRLEFEIRSVPRSSQNVIRHPDGYETTEMFVDDADLNERVKDLQHSLLASGWFVSGDGRR